MQIVDSGADSGAQSGTCLAAYVVGANFNAVAGLQNRVPSLHRFAVASSGCSASNQILVVDFDEDTHAASLAARSQSLHPVKHLLDFGDSADRLRFLVCEKDLNSPENRLKVLELDSADPSNLRSTSSSEALSGVIRSIALDPYTAKKSDARVGVVQPGGISLYKISGSGFKLVNSLEHKAAADTVVHSTPLDECRSRFLVGRFDPHHRDIFACAAGERFEVFDWRQAIDELVTVKNGPCHCGDVLDLDFNPNVPNELATAGEDGRIAFWDLRATARPVEVLEGDHKHCVQYVRFNAFHDQLILTGGPSATLLHLRDGSTACVHRNPSGSRLAAWSSTDAWHFASLVGAKLAFEAIPSATKYKLLL